MFEEEKWGRSTQGWFGGGDFWVDLGGIGWYLVDRGFRAKKKHAQIGVHPPNKILTKK